MIKVGIVGGTGYVAGELLRLLMHHPEVNIGFVYSHSHAGEKIAAVHDDLFLLGNMRFTGKVDPSVDVLFLSLGHGNSAKFLKKHALPQAVKVIDLSNDFRLKSDRRFLNRDFVYGLTEKNKEDIAGANNIANPGCFATAIQLALLPLARKKLLTDDLHVQGITGSTGAGRSLSETSHFSWRNNNVSVYKAFVHQHLNEIGETLKDLQPEFSGDVHFIPLRGNFSRGILITLYTRCDLAENDLQALYHEEYADKPFTVVSDSPIHLKQVVNTNFGLVKVEKHGNNAFVTVVIDNLLKGAAGQAIENMNLMVGINHETGLKLKPVYY